MNGIQVKFSEEKDWYTETLYYWPGAKKSLDFFAFSSKTQLTIPATDATPSGAYIQIEGQGSDLGGRKFTVKDYSIATADDAIDDLMVADFVRQHQGLNDQKVSLNFHHALSKVIFKFVTNSVGNEAPVVVVKSLSIGDLNSKGNLEVTESTEAAEVAGTRQPVSLEWKNLTGTLSVSHTKDYTLTTSATKYAEWLLIPQEITENTVSISYTIGGKPRTTIFKLSTDELTTWGVNQAITYTVNLSPNLIKFVPSVEDWEEVTGNLNTDAEEEENTPATTDPKEYVVLKIDDADAADGTKISITQAGETIAVGDTTTAADGTYTLEDGTIVKVASKVVTEVTAPTTQQNA
jgi:hypothetical protein